MRHIIVQEVPEFGEILTESSDQGDLITIEVKRDGVRDEVSASMPLTILETKHLITALESHIQRLEIVFNEHR